MRCDGGRPSIRVHAVLAKVHHGRKAGSGKGLPQMGEEVRVVVPAEIALLLPPLEDITDGGRGDWRATCRCGFKKRGMEAKDPSTVGTGALGKEQHWNRELKPVGDLARYVGGAGTAGTVDEDGPATARGFTEEGPAVYLSLSDKEAGHRRAEDDDIEITEVIRNHKALTWRLALNVAMNAQDRDDSACG